MTILTYAKKNQFFDRPHAGKFLDFAKKNFIFADLGPRPPKHLREKFMFLVLFMVF